MAEWSGLSQKLGSSLMYSYLWSLSLPVTSAECQWGTVTMMGADSSTASFSSTAAATSGFLFFGSSERATDGLQVKSWKHMFGNRQRRLISLCSRWLHFHLYQRKRKKKCNWNNHCDQKPQGERPLLKFYLNDTNGVSVQYTQKSIPPRSFYWNQQIEKHVFFILLIYVYRINGCRALGNQCSTMKYEPPNTQIKSACRVFLPEMI